MLTPNYRFVCPQLASTAKIAEVHHKHNGIYEELRSTSQNPEALNYEVTIQYQKVHCSGRVPLKPAKRQFGT
ncbi:hypothetical protein [Reichenbachiella sp. 5M10]|uniref:hypothetical protein n=1 Tax=Reichenbachiella sp. 5M10 TaxID=1889772 RepID=UPI00117B94FE|nr:hypothetical protein [Reichenbachiella sp. 5M10]